MTLTRVNSHDPSNLVAAGPVSSHEDLARSVLAASNAFQEWSRLPALFKSGCLEAVAEELSAVRSENRGLVVR